MIWLIALLSISVSLGIVNNVRQRDCSKRLGVDSVPSAENKGRELLPCGTHEMIIYPCGLMWESLPLWLRMLAITWLISLAGLLRSLLLDFHGAFLRRSHRSEKSGSA